MTLSRQYAKLCDLGDFDDSELLATIRTLLPERNPTAHVERKVWEFAMVAMFLDETAHLNGRSRILSVGAGDERILFWLTNRVGEVVATDIYGRGEFGEREAHRSMLDDPASHAPRDYPWRPDRLEVFDMDARRLEFPDESFDAVFTISSIEHFGSPVDIARAASEIGRVLRPGGHAAIVTDYLVRRHPLNSAPFDFALRAATLGRRRRGATPRRRVSVEGFTRRELARTIVGPSGLDPMQELDDSLSAGTWSNVATAASDGSISTRSGCLYPLILVRAGRSVLDSVCLVLAKPG